MTRERTTQRRRLKLLSALPLLCMIQSCSASGKSGAAIDACILFPAPSYSSKDTPETIRWFEGTKENPGYAVRYDRLCAR